MAVGIRHDGAAAPFGVLRSREEGTGEIGEAGENGVERRDAKAEAGGGGSGAIRLLRIELEDGAAGEFGREMLGAGAVAMAGEVQAEARVEIGGAGEIRSTQDEEIKRRCRESHGHEESWALRALF